MGRLPTPPRVEGAKRLACPPLRSNRLVFRPFLGVGRQFGGLPQPQWYILTKAGRPGHGLWQTVVSGIYHLLCMFNGFAFPWPLCRPIKVNLTGGWVYVLLSMCRRDAGAGRKWGDDVADGVDQPIYLPHDV
jgi:hypothetical protein